MHKLDLVLGVILLLSFLFGLRKGFLNALLALLGNVVAVYVGIRYSDGVALFLAQRTDFGDDLNAILGFFIVFVGVMLIFVILGRVLTKIASFMMLGMANKLLGGLFNMLKIAFLVSVVFMFVEASSTYRVLDPIDRDASILYGPVASLAPMILPEIEKNFKDLEWDSGILPKSEADETSSAD